MYNGKPLIHLGLDHNLSPPLSHLTAAFLPLRSCPSPTPRCSPPVKNINAQQHQLNFLRFRGGGGGNSGRSVSLGGKNTVNVNAGDRLTILTPGGGGHGTPPSPLSMEVDGGGVGVGVGTGDLEDPDRKSRREAEMRLGGSVSGHRLGQEQA